MTQLAELDAEFVQIRSNGFCRVPTLEKAQGILFTCPGCYRKNNNSDIGVHSVLVWFADRNVPAEAEPLHRWKVSGTSMANVSLQPSINLATSEESKDEWHGYVTDGHAI